MLLVAMCSPLSAKDELGSGKKVLLGAGGVVLGAALSIYCHTQASKCVNKLELLEKLKNAISEGQFFKKKTPNGVTPQEDKELIDLIVTLQQANLWSASQGVSMKDIATMTQLDAKIVDQTKKLWLYSIFRILGIGGAVVSTCLAIDGIYHWNDEKPITNTPKVDPKKKSEETKDGSEEEEEVEEEIEEEIEEELDPSGNNQEVSEIEDGSEEEEKDPENEENPEEKEVEEALNPSGNNQEASETEDGSEEEEKDPENTVQPVEEHKIKIIEKDISPVSKNPRIELVNEPNQPSQQNGDKSSVVLMDTRYDSTEEPIIEIMEKKQPKKTAKKKRKVRRKKSARNGSFVNKQSKKILENKGRKSLTDRYYENNPTAKSIFSRTQKLRKQMEEQNKRKKKGRKKSAKKQSNTKNSGKKE